MNNEPFETEVDPRDHGRFRAEQHRRHLIESAANATQASMASHAATSPQLRAAHQGLYGHATPQELGAAVAERGAVVGSDYNARPLERQGGLYDPAQYLCSPVPARVYAQNKPADQLGASPLLRFMEGR